MVYSDRLGRFNHGLSCLHIALKICGIVALTVALFRDSSHASIYVPAIAALATSHRLLK